jgi:predicted transcriptional regulator
MISTTLSVKVDIETAAKVQELAKWLDQTVSELLREYVDAIAARQRWQFVDADEELIGYAFLLTTRMKLQGRES